MAELDLKGVDRVLAGGTLATLASAAGDIGRIEDGVIALAGDRVAWVGARAQASASLLEHRALEELEGRLVTPALIDCHTHLVYAGNRAAEFEQRLHGADYESIARAGGGILSTVRATRDASEAELEELAWERLGHLAREGVAVVEVKSGYGLDLETELKMLRVGRRLGDRAQSLGVKVVTTLLAAHTVPPEYAGRADDYVEKVCSEILPEAHRQGLADAADVFCEGIAFDLEQSRRVLEAAADLGLTLRIHAEQLSRSGGARLAAELGATSADHLEYLERADAEAMAAAGTVAVLLPGAFYTLREARQPPVADLRSAGVPMALATDWNPGSSPLASLQLAMNMACTLFRLTPSEAFAGVTLHAAQALGLADDYGSLEAGKRADLLVWDLDDPAELSYRIGGCPEPRRILGGVDRP